MKQEQHIKALDRDLQTKVDSRLVDHIVKSLSPYEFADLPVSSIGRMERNAVRRRHEIVQPPKVRERTTIEAVVRVLMWQQQLFLVAPNPYSDRVLQLTRDEAAAICSLAFNELYGMRIYAQPTAAYKSIFERGFCVLDEDADGEMNYQLFMYGASAWHQLTEHYLDFVLRELHALMNMLMGNPQ